MTTGSPIVSIVCPTEFSNKCVTTGTNSAASSNDICGCVVPGSSTNAFCNSGEVCKASTSTGNDFACRDCATGECPAHAPHCVDASKRCQCGSRAASLINVLTQNTCTTEDENGEFSCGKPGTGAGTSCITGSLNPKCLNNLIDTSHGMMILGDPTSTCKVIVYSFKKIVIKIFC